MSNTFLWCCLLRSTSGSNFESVDDNQMEAIEQYFPAVLCIMLYKVTFESVHEILNCAVLFSDAVYYALEGGST